MEVFPQIPFQVRPWPPLCPYVCLQNIGPLLSGHVNRSEKAKLSLLLLARMVLAAVFVVTGVLFVFGVEVARDDVDGAGGYAVAC